MTTFTTWVSFAEGPVDATILSYTPADICPPGRAWEDSYPDEPSEMEITLRSENGLVLDNLATDADWARIEREAEDYLKESCEL